jgi:hypothetical protein
VAYRSRGRFDQTSECAVKLFFLLIRKFEFFAWKDRSVKFSNARFRANESSVPLVELTIRNLKDQTLAHFPSGVFCANSARTVIGALAHNLARWSTLPGLPGGTVRTARTLRRCLLEVPRPADPQRRRWTLHLPPRWSWQEAFVEALTRIRALPVAAA